MYSTAEALVDPICMSITRMKINLYTCNKPEDDVTAGGGWLFGSIVQPACPAWNVIHSRKRFLRLRLGVRKAAKRLRRAKLG